ncbi:MAG TPA: hypothetical protein VHM25_20710 [Polyangiaceae bacterium]|nr:hypothetical protein [Polyangiaceae bacterium]
MRLAIVAASSYEENGQVSPIPNAELDVELFGSRLAEADAGFTVHAFPAQRGLADAMEALIAGLGERPEALIFYFWGYALDSKEHGPTLLLDGPRLSSFTLARLRRLAADAADVSLIVLDTTLAEGSIGEPLDAVRAMGRALSHGDSTVSSLIAARPPEQRVPEGPPPFTGLLQMILDAQTGSDRALTPETLFRAMQSEEVMFADIPAAGCFLGQRDFEVVPPARPLTVRPPSVQPPSFPPPPGASSPPPLFPPLTVRPPSIPAPPPIRPPSIPPSPSVPPPLPRAPTAPPPGFPPPGPRASTLAPLSAPPPPLGRTPSVPPEPILRGPSVPPPPPPPIGRAPTLPPPPPPIVRAPSVPPEPVEPAPSAPPEPADRWPSAASEAIAAAPSAPPEPLVRIPSAPPAPIIRPPSVPPAALHYEEQDELTAPRARERARSAAPPPPPIRKSVAPSAPSLAAAEPVSPPTSNAAEHCRRLIVEFDRVGDRDGAYRAAEVLEALGEADLHEALLAANHRPDGLQAVRGALSYTDWHERLSAGHRDPHTDAVLRAISPALARVGFQHARRLRREPVLSEESRQDPERSTTTLAKTLHWTSRLLCVPAAELYLVPEGMDSLGLVPGPDHPILTCGRALGSGFSLPELVCVWARELSFARPEQAALCYFPNGSELSQLLSAALAVGGAVGLRAIDDDAKRLASGLKREVRGPGLAALEAAARAYPVREVTARAQAFIRSAEFVSGRAALVASGTLSLALTLDQRFPRRFLTRADERRADLLRFMVSPEFGQIRQAIGVAVA